MNGLCENVYTLSKVNIIYKNDDHEKKDRRSKK